MRICDNVWRYLYGNGETYLLAHVRMYWIWIEITYFSLLTVLPTPLPPPPSPAPFCWMERNDIYFVVAVDKFYMNKTLWIILMKYAIKNLWKLSCWWENDRLWTFFFLSLIECVWAIRYMGCNCIQVIFVLLNSLLLIRVSSHRSQSICWCDRRHA